jgi:hypothetical protein
MAQINELNQVDRLFDFCYFNELSNFNGFDEFDESNISNTLNESDNSNTNTFNESIESINLNDSNDSNEFNKTIFDILPSEFFVFPEHNFTETHVPSITNRKRLKYIEPTETINTRCFCIINNRIHEIGEINAVNPKIGAIKAMPQIIEFCIKFVPNAPEEFVFAIVRKTRKYETFYFVGSMILTTPVVKNITIMELINNRNFNDIDYQYKTNLIKLNNLHHSHISDYYLLYNYIEHFITNNK